jgi:hypothetical protein
MKTTPLSLHHGANCCEVEVVDGVEFLSKRPALTTLLISISTCLMEHGFANLDELCLFVFRPRTSRQLHAIRGVIPPSIPALLSTSARDFFTNLGPLIRSLVVGGCQCGFFFGRPGSLLLIVPKHSFRCSLDRILCTLRQSSADLVPEIPWNVALPSLATDVVVGQLHTDVVLFAVFIYCVLQKALLHLCEPTFVAKLCLFMC